MATNKDKLIAEAQKLVEKGSFDKAVKVYLRVVAEDDKVAQAEKLFREAVDLYYQGKFSDSQRKLKDVLALDPRKALAARLSERFKISYTFIDCPTGL